MRILLTYGTLNTMVHVSEMIMMLKLPISNMSNGYSMYIDCHDKLL